MLEVSGTAIAFDVLVEGRALSDYGDRCFCPLVLPLISIPFRQPIRNALLSRNRRTELKIHSSMFLFLATHYHTAAAAVDRFPSNTLVIVAIDRVSRISISTALSLPPPSISITISSSVPATIPLLSYPPLPFLAHGTPPAPNFRVNVTRTLKRLSDGHCIWINSCCEYCGTVGGQSADFSSINTEIKIRPMHAYPSLSRCSPLVQTAQLKNNSLAPPDLLVNGTATLQTVSTLLNSTFTMPTSPPL
ncbi:hypothetical protein C8R45DRAFT_942918 [Mycena sanguinolenta]|nr:hypothetical protein C8R45DRAFT_942918 [Mycena sanguinolenta]